MWVHARDLLRFLTSVCLCNLLFSAQKARKTAACPCPIVARKADKEKTHALWNGKRYFVNTDTKQTFVPKNESTLHKRCNCAEGSGTQRPQGEDPRAPGRKGNIIIVNTTNDWMLEKK